jgi:hypothetical protein
MAGFFPLYGQVPEFQMGDPTRPVMTYRSRTPEVQY